jgi:D-serine dehydratase
MKHRELESLKNEPLEEWYKGLPAGARIAPNEVCAQRWNLIKGDLPFPLLVLKESALDHNLRAMARMV